MFIKYSDEIVGYLSFKLTMENIFYFCIIYLLFSQLEAPSFSHLLFDIILATPLHLCDSDYSIVQGYDVNCQ